MTTLLLLLAFGATQQAAIAEVDALQQRMVAVNQAIWSYAEPGLEEVRSSEQLQDWLRENGFTIRAGVADMPTAFVASYGSGAPVIAYLAEYDALLGLSQKAVPRREPREDPSVVAGHGCGHSLFGTGSTAAAIALKRTMEAQHLSGTVRLYGTPAEETVDAKTFMLRAGVFDDADVVLAWHAADKSGTSYAYSKAVATMRFTFEGRSAHASTSPHQGRSALDAVELMNVGVNFLREHVPEDTRIHYVITDGGRQPNVVPPVASSWYYIRADRHQTVESVYARVLDIARGAALMTGTQMSHVVEGDSHEVLPNRALAERIHQNLVAVGAPQFTDDEKAFARQTQAELASQPEWALFEGIEPLPHGPEQRAHSTDQGDLTWYVPSGGLNVAAYTYGAAGHSWQVVACTGTSIGDKAMTVAAKVLAATGADLLTDPALLDAVRTSFHEIRDHLTFTTLLPDDARPPERIRKP